MDDLDAVDQELEPVQDGDRAGGEVGARLVPADRVFGQEDRGAGALGLQLAFHELSQHRLERHACTQSLVRGHPGRGCHVWQGVDRQR
ncbi:hypothetical protein ACFC0C_22440 [Streptomyces sp. NPDC056178]|uniref:hypothetical protein n=1 Tax=unclassified Streptomyces TaxID=2593676 RepID=UPI0035DCD691